MPRQDKAMALISALIIKKKSFLILDACTVRFTHSKGTVVFRIFRIVQSAAHVNLEHFHHPERNPGPISSHSPCELVCLLLFVYLTTPGLSCGREDLQSS